MARNSDPVIHGAVVTYKYGTSLLATGNNEFAPTTFATGSVNRAGSQLSGSLTKAGEQFSSSRNSLSKTVSDTVSRVTGALAGGAK